MKRKVLISVLAVALVLVLCIGVFAACDKDNDTPKTQYTVTFSLGDYDGATAAPADQKLDAGSKLTLPACPATWTGHTFSGWTADGGTTLYQPNDELTVEADLNFVAKWEQEAPPAPTTYTISYDLNGAPGTAPASVTKNEGETLNLPTAADLPAYPDHTFQGWKLNNEGDLLAGGATITVSANAKYYAQWKLEYTVTVYGPNDEELGKLTAMDNGGSYWVIDPTQEFELTPEQHTYFSYQLYDPATKETKGAFDCNGFEAGSYTIKIVAESIGDAATTIDDKFVGDYYFENRSGQISTVEISKGETSSTISLTLYTADPEPLEVSGLTLFSSIWEKDGQYIIENETELDEETTLYTYYAFSISADGATLTMTNLSDIVDGPYTFTRKPVLTVTVHYTLDKQEKTAELKTISAEGKGYMLNSPLEALDDAETLMSELSIGELYALYYYDDTATDKKGAAFDNSYFEATENFDIIIIKETVGALASVIDSSWYGTYAGSSSFGQPYTLKISNGEFGTTITMNDAMEDHVCKTDESIFTTKDGKLVLAFEDEFSASGYSYYYLTKNADESITMQGDNGTVQLAKQKVTATIHYSLNGEMKEATAEATPFGDDEYELSEMPEWYIPDEDYETFMGALVYGTQLKYYYYTDGQKGEEIDATELTFAEDIDILIEFETFAEPTDKIDPKFEGTFTAKLNSRTFTLTINPTAGTINLNYGDDEDAPNPIDASIEEGTILMTEDGQLVFVEKAWNGKVADASYYFIKAGEEVGFVLDTAYQKNIALAYSLADYAGTYTSEDETALIVSIYGAGDEILIAGAPTGMYASGSVIYNGELIKVYLGKQPLEGGASFTWAIAGFYNDQTASDSDAGVAGDIPNMFMATYAEGKFTITSIAGETIKEFGSRQTLTNALIGDFAGYWRQSDTQRYWSIAESGVTYGDTNPQAAQYAIIGDYIYLSYNFLSNTYAYLLKAQTTGDAKTLVGTYIAPEKAPAEVTFNASDRYADKSDLYIYQGDVTSTADNGTLHITKIVLNSCEDPTYAELTMAVDDGEPQEYKMWLEDATMFKALLPNSTKYPGGDPYRIMDGTSLISAHKFILVLVDAHSIDIYNFDTDEKEGTMISQYDIFKGAKFSSKSIDSGDYYALTFDGQGHVSGKNYYNDKPYPNDDFSDGTYAISEDGTQLTLNTKKNKIDHTYEIAAGGKVLILKEGSTGDPNGFVYMAQDGYTAPAPTQFLGYWENEDASSWIYIYTEGSQLKAELKGIKSIYSITANGDNSKLKIMLNSYSSSGVHIISLEDDKMIDVLDTNDPVELTKKGDIRPFGGFDENMVGTWTTTSGLTLKIESDKLTIGETAIEDLLDVMDTLGDKDIFRYTFSYQGTKYYIKTGYAQGEYYLFTADGSVNQQVLYPFGNSKLSEDLYGTYNGTLDDKAISIVIDENGIKVNGIAATKFAEYAETEYKTSTHSETYKRSGIAFSVAGLKDGLEGCDGDFALVLDTYKNARDYTLELITDGRTATLKKQRDAIEEPEGFTLDGAWYGGDSANGNFIRFEFSTDGAETITVYYDSTSKETVSRLATSGIYEARIDYEWYEITVQADGKIKLECFGTNKTYAGTYTKNAKPEQATIPQDLLSLTKIKCMPFNSSYFKDPSPVSVTANSLKLSVMGTGDDKIELTSYSISETHDKEGAVIEKSYTIVMSDWSKWSLFYDNDTNQWRLNCTKGSFSGASNYDAYLIEWFDDVLLDGTWAYTHQSYLEDGGEVTTKIRLTSDGTVSVEYGDQGKYSGTYRTTKENTIEFRVNGDGWTCVYDSQKDELQAVCSYSRYNQAYDGTYTKPDIVVEMVSYVGELNLENYYGEWTLVEIKFDKNDILNTLTFKLAGDDTYYTANCNDPTEIGGEPWLCYFKLNDGSQYNTMNYLNLCIKYGDDENTLIIANANTTTETYGQLTKAAA